MSKLIIVESPGKIKKIKSYLGPEYNVMASVGHICDLKKDNDSIDVNNNFNPTYEISKDKISVVKKLLAAKKLASEIIIAADGDREGEAIAYHLVTILKCKTNYKRIIFHEITKTAINNALNNPTLIDMNMFYSQQTRRLLDRLVGYKISPILRQIDGIKTNSLGAGRVQSVVTRLIVDKENEINNFMNSNDSSAYIVNGDFIINKQPFKAHLINYEFEKSNIIFKGYKNNIVNIKPKIIELYTLNKLPIKTKKQIRTIITKIKISPKFNISSVLNNETTKIPPQPFITSSLQQEASYKLKFKLKDTMQYAQRLYEKGLITYMRTDSPSLSAESLSIIKKHILTDLSMGERYYHFRQFKAKGNAQEAHEAIRPTNFNIFTINNLEGTNEEKLYQLIWNRTVASQMAPAKYNNQQITLINKNKMEFLSSSYPYLYPRYHKVQFLNQVQNIS